MSSQDARQASKRNPGKKDAQMDPKDALENMLLSAYRVALSLGDLSTFQDNNVTIAEWGVLKSIGNRQNVPLKEVGKAAGVSRQRLRKVMSLLETKSLVVGGKSEGEDKRAVLISGTSKGAAILSAISANLEQLFAEEDGDKRGPKRYVGAARAMSRAAKKMGRATQKSSSGKKSDADDEDDD